MSRLFRDSRKLEEPNWCVNIEEVVAVVVVGWLHAEGGERRDWREDRGKGREGGEEEAKRREKQGEKKRNEMRGCENGENKEKGERRV